MYCNAKAEKLANRIIAIWVANQHTTDKSANELIKEAGKILADEVNEHIQNYQRSDK